MRKGVMLAIVGMGFLAGCNQPANKASNTPAETKGKPPYHIELDTKAVKSNPTGVALPGIIYTANSKALEKRVALVVRFDATGVKNDQPNKDRVIMDPIDIPGPGGTLPSNYMDLTDVKLAKSLGGYCMKGTVKLNLALVRSSIRPDPSEAEINAKRLTDWLPAETVFKNPHPKC